MAERSRSSCSARCSACSPRCSRSGRAATARGYQFLALALLLVLVASPVVSIGGTQPVVLGLALTALTVCFLWLERLPLRPGLGIAAMLGAGAGRRAAARVRRRPARSRGSTTRRSRRASGPTTRSRSTGATPTGRSPGRATAPRCCASTPGAPSYWKVADLDDFDGERVGRRAACPPVGLAGGRPRDGLAGRPAVARARCGSPLRRIETRRR